MFVSSGQFFVFLACIAFGGLSGIVFILFSPLKRTIKSTIIDNVIDFISMCVIAFLYLLFAKFYKFPSLRAYMIIGVLLGIFCYFKSFNIILAKARKKFYNIIIKYKRRKGNGRTKVKKSS